METTASEDSPDIQSTQDIISKIDELVREFPTATPANSSAGGSQETSIGEHTVLRSEVSMSVNSGYNSKSEFDLSTENDSQDARESREDIRITRTGTDTAAPIIMNPVATESDEPSAKCPRVDDQTTNVASVATEKVETGSFIGPQIPSQVQTVSFIGPEIPTQLIKAPVVDPPTPLEEPVDEAASPEMPIPDSAKHIDWSTQPTLITEARKSFSQQAGNFLKGCKWSPDGTCILTNSDDNRLRLFNLVYDDAPADLRPAVTISEGECVYDYCWFPMMSSNDPASCCLATTSRDAPIHLWDAWDGSLRATYRSYDQADELIAAHSLMFSPDGTKLYAGFNKAVRIFEVDRPGRESDKRDTFVKQGQPGIISSMDINPSNTRTYALGSYARSVALYDDRNGKMLCMFQGQRGGVTHVRFSADGSKLFCGGRKDPEIVCWDMRQPGHVLYSMQRVVNTNQRVYFALDSQHLISGNLNGSVYVWDTETEILAGADSEPVLDVAYRFSAHEDMVNGVSVHPTLPILATASGQRHFDSPDIQDSESENESEGIIGREENCLKLWRFGTI